MLRGSRFFPTFPILCFFKPLGKLAKFYSLIDLPNQNLEWYSPMKIKTSVLKIRLFKINLLSKDYPGVITVRVVVITKSAKKTASTHTVM